MKRLLVPLFGDERDNIALSAAIKLASTGNVHIDARTFLHDPVGVIPYIGEGISATAAQRLLEAAEDNNQRQEESAKSNFNKWCDTEKIIVGDTINNGHSSANFSSIIGHLPKIIVPTARLADINIFVRGRDDDDLDWGELLQTALFESGRPSLLVPPIVPTSIAKRIIIAWNGSAEAARAVAMTMPLLLSAEAVFIVSIDGEDDDYAPSHLATTLEMNGITATPLSIKADERSVSSILTAKALKVNADMIVIGAYSHNRLGEMIFGGVTHDLKNRADFPILMVH